MAFAQKFAQFSFGSLHRWPTVLFEKKTENSFIIKLLLKNSSIIKLLIVKLFIKNWFRQFVNGILSLVKNIEVKKIEHICEKYLRGLNFFPQILYNVLFPQNGLNYFIGNLSLHELK